LKGEKCKVVESLNRILKFLFLQRVKYSNLDSKNKKAAGVALRPDSVGV
jgi:hypothetical protein